MSITATLMISLFVYTLALTPLEVTGGGLVEVDEDTTAQFPYKSTPNLKFFENTNDDENNFPLERHKKGR